MRIAAVYLAPILLVGCMSSGVPAVEAGKPSALLDVQTRDSFVGDSFVGDSFVGDSFVGDSFVGDSFVGDSFAGDSFAGDSGRGDVVIGGDTHYDSDHLAGTVDDTDGWALSPDAQDGASTSDLCEASSWATCSPEIESDGDVAATAKDVADVADTYVGELGHVDTMGAADGGAADGGAADGGAADGGAADGGAADTADSTADANAPPTTLTTCPAKAVVTKLSWSATPAKGKAVPAVHCAKTGWPASPTKATLAFKEVSAAMGITPGGLVDTGLAAGDYDGDGDVDLIMVREPMVLAGPRTLLHFHNQLADTGKPGFTLTTAPLTLLAAVKQCVSADLDGDGDLDVLMATGAGVLVLRNDAGVLTEVTIQLPAKAHGATRTVAVIDYDLDGDLDLLTVPSMKSPTPTMSNPCVCKPAPDKPYTHCAGGICLSRDDDLMLLRNNGNLSFTYVATLPHVEGMSWTLSIHDLDRDGWPDIFVGTEWGSHAWLRNNGDGTFTKASQSLGLRPYAHIMGSAVADYNGDGWMDIFAADYGADTLYLSKGDTSFSNGSQQAQLWKFGITASSWSSLAVDLDFNGWPDIAIATSIVMTPKSMLGVMGPNVQQHIPGTGHLLQQNFGGTFTGHWLPYPQGTKPRIDTVSWASADFDGDGDIDLVGTAQPGHVALYRNDTKAAGHWLALKFTSKTSAPAGEGAWVFVWAGGHVQQRYITHSRGRGSDGTYAAVFGLGAVTHVDMVRVRWPAGTITELKPAGVDTWLTVIH